MSEYPKTIDCTVHWWLTHLYGDDLGAGDLEHGVHEELLEDAAQPARPRLPLDRQPRDRLQRPLRERQVDLKMENVLSRLCQEESSVYLFLGKAGHEQFKSE